jgi:predicted nuclease of predicted toxin-antitoxin system
MKLLIDMNLSPAWVGYLVSEGFEAAHWSSVGDPTASDRQLTDYAQAGGWVILTHDLDFGAILAASGRAGPSVMQIRADDLSLDAIGAAVVAAMRQLTESLTAGALVTVEPARTRVSILPLRGG